MGKPFTEQYQERICISTTYTLLGESGSLGENGLDEADGYRHLLVTVDDMSNFVCLGPAGACTARLTTQHFFTWRKKLGVPDTRVSCIVYLHFQNKVMTALENALGAERRCSVAKSPWSKSPWSNGTCERMVREVARTFMMQERRLNIRGRVDVFPVVQRALSTAFRERYESTP